MYSLILKITNNTAVKDSIAVARGIYRVAQTLLPGSANNNRRVNSWMDDFVQDKDKSKQQKLQNTLNSSTQQTKTSNIPQIKQKTNKEYLKQLKQIPISTPQIFNTQISKIPSGRISRIVSFGRLGLRLASASIFSKGKQQAQYQQLAESVTNQLCKMRGAPLKLAQMLSIQQQSLIPTPIRKAFDKARESAHIIPQKQVQFMLQKNLGSKWRDIFQQFNINPFAAASIGQVHRGKLANGENVAVKIQYYQVKESINSDIANLGLLMKLPGLIPKGMYIDRILKKTKQQLMQECDYLLQKYSQQKYSKYLKQSLGRQSQLYHIPHIYEKWSTQQILISQYAEGIKLKQLQQNNYSQELKDQIGRRVMLLTFKQIFQMGIIQSDPNPSNYTYNYQKDQLNLFDFGATHIYGEQFLSNYYRIIHGAVQENLEQVWDGSIKTGFVTNQENKVMRNSHIQSILITGEPLRFKGKYDFGAQNITKKIYKTIPMMLKNRLKPPPEQVYSLHRKLSGSYLTCIRLKARVNCNEIWKNIQFKSLAAHEKCSRPVRSSQK